MGMVERHRPGRVGQARTHFELRVVGQQGAGQDDRRRRVPALDHHARGRAHHRVGRHAEDAEEDQAVFDQRDKTPAEPVRFE